MSPIPKPQRPAYPTISHSVVELIYDIHREHEGVGVEMSNKLTLEFNVGRYTSLEMNDQPVQIIIATSNPDKLAEQKHFSLISVRQGPDVQLLHIDGNGATNAISGEPMESETMNKLKRMLEKVDFNDRQGVVKLSERMAAGTYDDWVHAMFDIF